MKKDKDRDFQKKHRTEWHDFLWDKFLERFSHAKSREAINLIFTSYEKRLITKRLAALSLIGNGASTKEIENLLWLSRATIGALKKSLFGKPAVYKSQRFFKGSDKNKSHSFETKKESWLEDIFHGIDLWDLIKNPPRPRGIGLKG